MRDVDKYLGQVSGYPNLSAIVTVVAMLMAGLLAKIESARWGLIVVVMLCAVHIVLGLMPPSEGLSAPPEASPGE
jgi:hypothetical protein